MTQWDNPQDKEYAEANGITAIQGKGANGLGLEVIHHNQNSGAMAVNLAYLKGATRIILVGYDMKNTDGKAHFFGNHPHEWGSPNYAVYVQRFNYLATDLEREGVEVINCSRETALHQFRRASLEEVYGQA